MEANNNEYERYQRAQKQVKDIKEFYGHLITYAIVILFFLFINLKYTPEHLWFYWPMLGWGIGLLFHGMRVFNFSLLGKDWEQRKLKQFMNEEKQNRYETEGSRIQKQTNLKS